MLIKSFKGKRGMKNLDVARVIKIVNTLNDECIKEYGPYCDQLKVAVKCNANGYEVVFNQDLIEFDSWAQNQKDWANDILMEADEPADALYERKAIFDEFYDETEQLLWIIYPELFQQL